MLINHLLLLVDCPELSRYKLANIPKGVVWKKKKRIYSWNKTVPWWNIRRNKNCYLTVDYSNGFIGAAQSLFCAFNNTESTFFSRLTPIFTRVSFSCLVRGNSSFYISYKNGQGWMSAAEAEPNVRSRDARHPREWMENSGSLRSHPRVSAGAGNKGLHTDSLAKQVVSGC